MSRKIGEWFHQPAVARVLSLADGSLGLFVLCLIVSLSLLYNFIFPLNAILSTDGRVWNDPAQSVWSLWFVERALTSRHSPYSTDMIFYPLGSSLIHHTLFPGFFPITYLTKKLSGGDVMYPVYAQHIIVLLCFTLTLYITFLLLRRLDCTRVAAAIGAVGFTFSDFFVEHIPHLNVLAGFFIPLLALLLLQLYRRPGAGAAFACAVTASLTIYFTELVVYALVALLVFLLAATLAGRKDIWISARQLGFGSAAICAAVSVVIMGPFLLNFFSVGTTKPLFVESSNFSANLAGFIIPDSHRTPLYNEFFSHLAERESVGIAGHETFLGFPLLVLATLAVLRAKEKLIWVLAVVSLVMFLLSLGPTLKVLGTETGVPLPYALLMRVPPFNLARTPVRFVVMGLFFLTIVAARGMVSLQQALRSRLGRQWSIAVVVLVAAWAIAEAYSPVSRQPPFQPPSELAKLAEGAVLNLPVSQFDGYAALLQVFHKRPIATGYISRLSEQQLRYVEELMRLADSGGPRFCETLKQTGISNIIFNPVRDIQAPFDLSGCDINVVDLRRPEQEYAAYDLGTKIDFSRPEAQRYLGYGWSTSEPSSRWTDRTKAVIAFRLQYEKTAVLRMRLAPFLVPGKLDQQVLNIELNGRPLAFFRLRQEELKEYSTRVQPDVLSGNNVLILKLPDAESPANLQVGEDTRLLGVRVQSFVLSAY